MDPRNSSCAKATAEGDPNKQQTINKVTNGNSKPCEKLFVSYKEPNLCHTSHANTEVVSTAVQCKIVEG